MQYRDKYEGVEAFKAITLSVNDADSILFEGVREIVLPKNSPYRGNVVFVTSLKPKNIRGGMVVGRARVDDVRETLDGYVWSFSDVHRMIEFPAQKSTMKGFVWDLYYTEGVLEDYPEISLRNILPIFKNK